MQKKKKTKKVNVTLYPQLTSAQIRSWDGEKRPLRSDQWRLATLTVSSCTKELRGWSSSVREMTRWDWLLRWQQLESNVTDPACAVRQVFFASVRSGGSSQVYFMTLNRNCIMNWWKNSQHSGSLKHTQSDENRSLTLIVTHTFTVAFQFLLRPLIMLSLQSLMSFKC